MGANLGVRVWQVGLIWRRRRQVSRGGRPPCRSWGSWLLAVPYAYSWDMQVPAQSTLHNWSKRTVELYNVRLNSVGSVVEKYNPWVHIPNFAFLPPNRALGPDDILLSDRRSFYHAAGARTSLDANITCPHCGGNVTYSETKHKLVADLGGAFLLVYLQLQCTRQGCRSKPI